ncbi:TRAP transporter small permease [Sneathiella litorea]|uniref:TRAP transporter small permease protein n=1 Tax=Sneathiella litorea TaxID=2606216 RepID=A0A6L8W6J9_9PROT|nr:TRAP transporter small permease [Sneathiella litorea]MZR30688.1 TRAP transporter small permease subunit [Sneathiella litorea]
MKMLRHFLRCGLGIFGGVALVVMMLHITAEVLLRSFANVTIPGTIELVSVYYMVFVVFFGIALVQLDNDQLFVEIFMQWAPKKTLRLVDGFGAILTAAYAGILGYGAWLEARSSTKFGEMIPVRGYDLITWPSRWVVAFAFSAMVLFALFHAIALFRSKNGIDV